MTKISKSFRNIDTETTAKLLGEALVLMSTQLNNTDFSLYVYSTKINKENIKIPLVRFSTGYMVFNLQNITHEKDRIYRLYYADKNSFGPEVNVSCKVFFELFVKNNNSFMNDVYKLHNLINAASKTKRKQLLKRIDKFTSKPNKWELARFWKWFSFSFNVKIDGWVLHEKTSFSINSPLIIEVKEKEEFLKRIEENDNNKRPNNDGVNDGVNEGVNDGVNPSNVSEIATPILKKKSWLMRVFSFFS
jgi:hypothetical protein